MIYEKALFDINKSAPSFGKNNESTGISGFANRLVNSYGSDVVLAAVDQSLLTPLQAGWVKRWIKDMIIS